MSANLIGVPYNHGRVSSTDGIFDDSNHFNGRIPGLHNTGILSRVSLAFLHYQYVVFGLIIFWVVFDMTAVALHTPLGTDELMARVSAESSSMSRMLTLLRDQPVNVDAPVFPILAYLAAKLPLPIDFAIRVPAILAICVAVFAIFALVRDQLGVAQGFLAATFLSINAFTLFGARARPYAFLLAAVALVLFCWQRAIRTNGKRRVWLVALFCSCALALLSHYFAAVSIFAVVVGEITRGFLRRKMDWPVLVAISLAGLAFLPVYLTFAPAGQPYRAHPFDRLFGLDLIQTYIQTVNFHGSLTAMAMAGLAALFGARKKKHSSLSAPIWVAAVLLTVGPLFLFAAGQIYTHTYATRYGICAVIGTVLILSAIVNFIAGGNQKIVLLACILTFAFDQGKFVTLSRQPDYAPASLWANSSPRLLDQHPNLPLITPDFDYWMRIQFYSPSWLSSRVIMMTNPQSMLKFRDSENPALATLAIHRWTGWPLVDYYEFTKSHRQFLMYGEYWLYDALHQDHAKIRLLDYLGPYRLYLVELPQTSPLNQLDKGRQLPSSSKNLLSFNHVPE